MSPRGYVLGALLTVLLVTAGCDALLVEPAPGGAGSRVQFAFSDARASAPFSTDPGEVMAQVREVHFRFTREGEVRDTVARARFLDGELTVRVRLHPEEASGWLEVEADLVDQRLPLFRGHAVLQGHEASPSARIEVEPVPGSVTIHPILTTFTALGAPLDLEAVVRFHSGDPINAVEVAWTSSDADVVELLPGPRALPRQNGVAVIRASAGEARARRTLHVAQTPVRLTGVAPADTTIQVGENFQLRPFGEDPNGYPLLPGAKVEWVSTGAVAVDVRGVVTGLRAGAGNVDAVFESNTHRTRITVVDP